MIFVERDYCPDRWLFGKEDVVHRITSVGVLIYTGSLKPRGYACFLLVEQLDQPGFPWGIPAGRVIPGETRPEETAIREVKEETDLVISRGNLVDLGLVQRRPDSSSAFFSYQVTEKEVRALGDWRPVYQRRWVPSILLLRREPGIEVGDLALVPAERMFELGNLITSNPYRWDSFVLIKRYLKGLKLPFPL